MLTIGEGIGTSRKQIDEAGHRRDAAFIQADVRAQVVLNVLHYNLYGRGFS
jgi:hypothetical protein